MADPPHATEIIELLNYFHSSTSIVKRYHLRCMEHGAWGLCGVERLVCMSLISFGSCGYVNTHKDLNGSNWRLGLCVICNVVIRIYDANDL